MGYKFLTTDGKTVACNIVSSDYPIRSEDTCRSKAQFRFGRKLQALFGGDVILEEFIMPQMRGLSLDFFIPRLKLAFEIDGRQHSTFVPYLHGTLAGFEGQKRRDGIKEKWCHLNKIRLIRVTDQDVDDFDILEAMGE
jgi:hypothetical protein